MRGELGTRIQHFLLMESRVVRDLNGSPPMYVLGSYKLCSVPWIYEANVRQGNGGSRQIKGNLETGKDKESRVLFKFSSFSLDGFPKHFNLAQSNLLQL